MSSQATALASLALIRQLRKTAEEMPALRQENAELSRRLRKLSEEHSEAVSDLVAKGRRLEDLMRHVIDDRNRIAAQLTVMQHRPSTGTTTSATQTDPHELHCDVGVQSESICIESCSPDKQGSTEWKNESAEWNQPHLLILSPEKRPRAGKPKCLEFDVGKYELRKLPAAAVVGGEASLQRSLMLLMHLASAQAEGGFVRLHWRVEGRRAFLGIYAVDGSIGWHRVTEGPPAEAPIGLAEGGAELAWCAALCVVCEAACPRTRTVADLARLVLSDRLHGPFPLDGLRAGALAQRMTELGDMLLLNGVEGEAVATAAANLGKTRVFLTAKVQRAAVGCLHATEVASEWLAAEELMRRFTTVTIAERWPRSTHTTVVRVPVAVVGGRCSVLLATPTARAGQSVLTEEGLGVDVSLWCSGGGAAATAHLCRVQQQSRSVNMQQLTFDVHCDTVLDCDAASMLLVAELDPSTGRSRCQPIRLGVLGSAGEFVQTGMMLQIDGLDCYTAELFAAVSHPSPPPVMFADACLQIGGGDDIQRDDMFLQEQREMVATVERLAAQIDAIELKATARCVSLLETGAELVCTHFSCCAAEFAETAGVALWHTYDWAAAWVERAINVAVEHVTTSVLPELCLSFHLAAARNYSSSVKILQWASDAAELVARESASEKLQVLMDAAPLSLAQSFPDECNPWLDDFVRHCSRWQAAGNELMWQRALTVSCAAVDSIASYCASTPRLKEKGARTSVATADVSSNTDAVAPVTAQQSCDAAAAAAQLAMYQQPFLEMLQLRAQLERQCVALRLSLSHKEDQLQSLEAHSSSLAMGNDALAAELNTRDVELEETLRRLQDAQCYSDHLQHELLDARTALGKSEAALHAAAERGNQQLAEKSRAVHALEAETASLRLQLEALKPALLSLTAPSERDRASAAGSVRQVSKAPFDVQSLKRGVKK
jgi:hypothetical protein